jgi:hypothetical protein
MSDFCTKCKREVEEKPLCCDGGCKGVYHLSCANLSRSTFKIISETVNVQWLCNECIQKNEMVSKINDNVQNLFVIVNKYEEKFERQESLIKSLSAKIDGMITVQSNNNNDIKKTLLKQNAEKNNISFADVLKKQNIEPVVVIKPKDVRQKSEETKKIVKEKIDPMQVLVNSVKAVAKGCVVIKCQDKNNIEECKKAIETKMGGDYEVTIPKQKNPSVKIVGLSEVTTKEKLVERIKAQNTFLDINATIDIIEFKEKRNKVFASFTCDALSFENIMKMGKLVVGWDRCRVYENFRVLRCFKCSGYHHTANECKNKYACPKCAQEHEITKCESSEKMCINCVTANQTMNLNFSTAHTSWDRDCPVYQRKINSEVRKINYTK